jgi:uncharacterized protein (TIGR00369 family)
MTVEELEVFITAHFPALEEGRYRVEEIDDRYLRVRMRSQHLHLRPGGTVSGPSLMALADLAMYLVLLAQIGPVVSAVTSSLNINFLRKPAHADVVAEAHLLRLGSRLAVGAVTIFSEGEEDPVAHATVTYSIPPR